ncbi:hypothetical protein [Vibrio ulleungensis]|uniref:PIN-like domain-containing protein n=1 Tax=Vibrio ulleungensis TaxID=2807619 RepID=A0ABS2HFV8_9VIBR|nr:hypothetical protein [Vibrio ulleungensis]MBM7035003.1 hypothetical protein [Vibrio ulleungensis]
MKFVFVDAENVGVKGIERVKATLADKVFVFSKSNSIQQHCEKELFHHLSDYPSGQNQADFYIISYLSRVLSTLEQQALASAHFELFSNDESLISAFEFQCKKLGAKFRVVRIKDEVVVPIVVNEKSNFISAEQKLYAALKSPKNLDPSFQEQLGLSRQAFTKAVNTLSSSNKIRRSDTDKKQWVQC